MKFWHVPGCFGSKCRLCLSNRIVAPGCVPVSRYNGYFGQIDLG